MMQKAALLRANEHFEGEHNDKTHSLLTLFIAHST